ncbi:ABC transporter permease [Sphingobacterium sp. HSC-15S19]|uniref:ABC transporter permease n=1 Tax=Sphingobacterium sp. HSC-15S19 TaxID=2910971 RepID=UPI003D262F4A
MNILIKIAIRNIRRNFSTTLLNGAGISCTAILLLLIFSLSKGIETFIVQRNIQFETGALSIEFDKQLLRQENNELAIPLLKEIESKLKNDRNVAKYSYRVYPPNCILYHGENQIKVNPNGMQKSDLPLFQDMFKVLAGKLEDENKGEVLISDGISKELNIKVKDKITIMAQSVDGTINLEEYPVGGIFRYTSLANKYNVYMDYNKGMSLYNSKLPSKIIIQVRNLDNIEEAKKILKTEITSIQESLNIPPSYIKISSYLDGIGLAKSLSNINRYSMMSLAFFLLMISFVGIWSMQTENRILREKETGTMLSFGFSGRSVRTIYSIESIYMGSIYTAIGITVVILIVKSINLQGGVFLGEAASFAFGSSIINPILTVKDISITILLCLFYPLLATLISLIENKRNTIEYLKNK